MEWQYRDIVIFKNHHHHTAQVYQGLYEHTVTGLSRTIWTHSYWSIMDYMNPQLLVYQGLYEHTATSLSRTIWTHSYWSIKDYMNTQLLVWLILAICNYQWNRSSYNIKRLVHIKSSIINIICSPLTLSFTKPSVIVNYYTQLPLCTFICATLSFCK